MSEDKQTTEQGEGRDQSGSRLRELYQTEDYWSIWLGLAIIAVGMIVFLPNPPEGMNETIEQSNRAMAKEAGAAPFRTLAWYRADDAKRYTFLLKFSEMMERQDDSL